MSHACCQEHEVKPCRQRTGRPEEIPAKVCLRCDSMITPGRPGQPVKFELCPHCIAECQVLADEAVKASGGKLECKSCGFPLTQDEAQFCVECEGILCEPCVPGHALICVRADDRRKRA